MNDDLERRWTERLERAAIAEVDRRAIVATENARSSVIERLEENRGGRRSGPSEDRDALHAWAVLGRGLADANGSPTLAAHTVDALVACAIGDAVTFAGDWVASARASLLESYVASQRDLAEARVAEAWRFPRCVVRLDESTAAVAACFPDDDSDALSRWADEVAAGLAKMSIRRVHTDGSARAKAALADALAVAGIDLARPPAR